MDVTGNHQIMAFGTELMRLFDSNTGDEIITAKRKAGIWNIHAETGDVPDVDAPTRADAITAMIDHALAALPGGGYSTLVPRGLPEMP